MPRDIPINLQFPLGGVDRNFAYQTQAPYTTVDAKNVRPRGSAEQRIRGGTRPGLTRAFGNRLGDVATGTATSLGTYDSDLDSTVVNASAGPFEEWHEGMRLYFDTSGNEYKIIEVNSTTQVTVRGDADGELGTDTLTIYAGNVNMVASMRDVVSAADNVWVDNFDGSSLDTNVWIASNDAGGIPSISTGTAYLDASNDSTTMEGAFRKLSIGSGVYTVSIDCRQYPNDSQNIHEAVYRVYVGVSGFDFVPGTTGQGVIVEVTSETGTATVTVTEYDDAATPVVLHTTTGGFQSTPDVQSNRITVDVDGTTIVTKIDGTNVFTDTAGVTLGTYAGFALKKGASGDTARVKRFTLNYASEDQVSFNRNRAFACCGGKLYRESNTGDMEAVTNASGNQYWITHDKPLQAAEFGGKLYIMDGEVLTSTTGSISTDELTDSSISDFRKYIPDLGQAEHDHNYKVYIAGSDNDYFDLDQSVNTTQTTITLDTNPTSSGTVTYTLFRVPKIYDPTDSTNPLKLWTEEADSSFPKGCNSLGVYNSRMVVAGQPSAPQVWYMSKINDPLTWATGTTNVSDPVAATDIDQMKLPEPVTAVCPVGDDYCFIGGTSNLSVLRGDPQLNGVLDVKSRRIGVLSPFAWTVIDDNTFVFLSRTGLYVVGPGAGGFPTALSHHKIPDELKQIDVRQKVVTLVNDAEDYGVNIFITDKDSAASSDHWWLDMSIQGQVSFWPMVYPEDMEPYSAGYYESDSLNQSGTLLGSRDGYLRRFDEDTRSDEGTIISSHVFYGPFGDGYSTTSIEELNIGFATTSNVTNALSVQVWVGDTAEQIYNNYSGTGAAEYSRSVLEDTRTKLLRPKRSFRRAYLLFTSTALVDYTFLVEDLQMLLRIHGKWKRTTAPV